MDVGACLYMWDVVKKSSRSLSHLLMSSCFYTFDVILFSFQRFTPTILGKVLTWILFNFCASAQSDGRRVFDRRLETKTARHGAARAAPT